MNTPSFETRELDETIALAAANYGLGADDLLGRRQDRTATKARHLAMHLIRTHTALSLPAIGRIFRRDHSSVFSGLKHIEDAMLYDPEFGVTVEILGAWLKVRMLVNRRMKADPIGTMRNICDALEAADARP